MFYVVLNVVDFLALFGDVTDRDRPETSLSRERVGTTLKTHQKQ